MVSVMNILTAKLVATGTATVGALGVDTLIDQLNSATTEEQKKGFLIQYFANQREPLMNFVKTLLIALIIFVVGRKLIKLFVKLAEKSMDRGEIDVSAHKFLTTLIRIGLDIVLIFIIAGMLGIGTSSIVAIVGSAGLTIGLALQGSLANFAGGVLILLMKPFHAGDYIVAAGVEGSVQSIDIFYTRIISADNKVITIPNGTLSNACLINNSGADTRLLIMDFMVDYQIETSQVRQILIAKMEQEEMILQDKPKSVVIDKLNPGRVKMQAKAWVKTSDYGDEKYRFMEIIKESLKENIC